MMTRYRVTYRELPILLRSREFTEGEKSYLEYYFGFTWGFTRNLFETIRSANPEERDKLALGYPEEVNAYVSWTTGSLKSRCDAVIIHEPLMGELKIS